MLFLKVLAHEEQLVFEILTLPRSRLTMAWILTLLRLCTSLHNLMCLWVAFEHKASSFHLFRFLVYFPTFLFVSLIESNPNGVDRFFAPRWTIIHLFCSREANFYVFPWKMTESMQKNNQQCFLRVDVRRVENSKHRFRSSELTLSSLFTGGKINSSRARCSVETIIVLMDFRIGKQK